MRIPFYQVDAFAAGQLLGNPAAVCPLDAWLPEEMMQAIAAENNLSETAFLVQKAPRHYGLRWFTPVAEVNLCGHATLASAWVVLHRLEALDEPGNTDTDSGRDAVTFDTRSGPLEVWKAKERLVMDFPARPARRCDPPPPALAKALGLPPKEVWATSRDFMAVFRTEEEVRELRPDLEALESLELPGTIVTAPGRACDFVSRFFAPALGVPEDPVTGSSHCTLIPYWAERLGKTALVARQLSGRGGELHCQQRGERVLLGGQAVLARSETISV